MKKQTFYIISAVIFVAAIFLRIYDLDLKPIHSDESVNGWFVGHMWTIGHYKYDPVNFHGPLFFYLLQLCEVIFGYGVEGLRMAAVLSSLLMLGVVCKFESLIGRKALVPLLFLSLSGGFLYYNRTAIHESTFVFFQVVMIYGLLIWRWQGYRRGVSWFFVGLTGCLLHKETSLIFFTVTAIAWWMAKRYPQWGARLFSGKIWYQSLDQKASPAYRLKSSEWRLYIGGSLLVLSMFYLSFFREPGGMQAFLQSLAPWLKEGLAGNHSKPFSYYFLILLQYEALFALALLGTIYSLFCGGFLQRFFALLTIGNFLAYSLIPYKTPWLIMSFVWPAAFYLGFLLADLYRLVQDRKALWRRQVALVLSGVIALLAMVQVVQSLHLNYVAYSSDDQPYAYVQGLDSVKWFDDYLQSVASKDPSLYSTSIQIFSDDLWPFPYLLRRWTRVELHPVKDHVRQAYAPILIVEKEILKKVVRRLTGKYHLHQLPIRQARRPMWILIKDDAKFRPLPKSKGWRVIKVKKGDDG